MKQLNKLRKFAKEYGFIEAENPEEFVERIGITSDGVKVLSIFTKYPSLMAPCYVLVYHQLKNSEDLEVNFGTSHGGSGNDSIEDWITEKYWKLYFKK